MEQEEFQRFCEGPVSYTHLQFISNNQPKLNTAGNGNLKDVIYRIYGRDIAMNLLEVHTECEFMKVDGFIGKPVISRGNRNFESYFINQRYIKSSLVAKGIEAVSYTHLILSDRSMCGSHYHESVF